MENYPLHMNKKNWRLLEPTNGYFTEEYLQMHHELYLTTEYSKNAHGVRRHYYRLNATKPHSIEMALAYEIRCPKCKTNHLKQVGRCKDRYTLGLYECPACDKDNRRDW